MPSYDRALWALRTWLDSWSGIGTGCGRDGAPRLRSPAHEVWQEGLAGHVLHDGDGALAHECDGLRVERTPWHAVQVAACEALRTAGHWV